LFGTDQRITSGPAAKRLHSKAEYMTAPERFADSQILFPCTAGCVSAAGGAADASETGGDVIDTSARDPSPTPTVHRSNRDNVNSIWAAITRLLRSVNTNTAGKKAMTHDCGFPPRSRAR
jgi:hypothetical protein